MIGIADTGGVSWLREIWGRPAGWGRAVPPLVADAAIAAACFLTLAAFWILEDQLAWWGVVLGIANTAPLLWRRRYPFTVTAIVGTFTTWLALTGFLGEIPAAALVVTYTYAALCPPLHRRILVTGTIAGLSISILVPNDSVLSLGRGAVMFAVAYALGTSARARRDRIAMLEERALRQSEEQQAAAARERERIAREMHDILAHSMSLVVVQAEAGAVVVRSDPDRAETVFDTISTTARQALRQLRRALGVLRSDQPAERMPQPGLDTLAGLVAGVNDAGVVATLAEEGQRRPVPPELAATAYRIVQEALTNTVRHAHATEVRVRLGWRVGRLELTVEDDGRGLGGTDSGGGDRAGNRFGLVGMRERVAAAGGELTIGPGQAGAGFRVAASLPIE